MVTVYSLIWMLYVVCHLICVCTYKNMQRGSAECMMNVFDFKQGISARILRNFNMHETHTMSLEHFLSACL